MWPYTAVSKAKPLDGIYHETKPLVAKGEAVQRSRKCGLFLASLMLVCCTSLADLFCLLGTCDGVGVRATVPPDGNSSTGSSSRDYCFWHFAYKDGPTVDASLSSLRKYAPRAILIIDSDHGDIFNETSRRYGAEAIMEPFSINLWNLRPPYNFTCGIYMNRLLSAASRCADLGARHFVLWEEDARLLAPLPELPPPYSVSYHANMEDEENFCCHAGTVLRVDMTIRLLPLVRDREYVEPCQDPCLLKATTILKNDYGITRGPWREGIAQFRPREFLDHLKLHIFPSFVYPLIFQSQDQNLVQCLRCKLQKKFSCGCTGFNSCTCPTSMALNCWQQSLCSGCPSIVHGFKRSSFDCNLPPNTPHKPSALRQWPVRRMLAADEHGNGI